MNDTNVVNLTGTVGRDPEIHTLKDGTKVAHTSLSTRRGAEDRRDWHRLTVRGALAEFFESRVKVGLRIAVTGRIEYDSYERDGVTIPSTEIAVREARVLDEHMYEVYMGGRRKHVLAKTAQDAIDQCVSVKRVYN